MAGDLATPGNENARLSGHVFSATYEYFRKNPIPFSNTCLPRQPREMPNEIGMTGSATPDNENTPIRAATYFQQLVRISGRTPEETGGTGPNRRYPMPARDPFRVTQAPASAADDAPGEAF